MRGVLVHSVMETPNIFFSGSSSRSQRETRKSGRIPKSQSRRGHKVHKSPKSHPANYISKPPSLSPSRRLDIEVPAAAMSISPYSSGSSSSSGTSVGGAIVWIGLVLALIVATIAGCMYCSRRKKRSGRLNGAGQLEAPSSVLLHHPSHDPSIINGQRRVGVVQLPSSSSFAPRSFSLEQLSVATNNFSRSELLGRGGFGRVYKGTLPAGNSSQLVAVKCISHDSRQGSKEFLAEVNIISDIRHKNVVRLLGWCSHEDGRLFLVYDYLPKGSLDKLLFDKERFVALSWSQRFSIMLGLGSAMRYLHEECERVIIHRDVKSSNVLLDENFEAKLGDFGLSRQVEQGAFAHTTDVAGTEGYMAPEVIYTCKATKEADVYSFGVVLAEVACGRRAMDRSLLAEKKNGTGMLVDWVWNLHSQRRLLEGADERLNRDFDAEQVNRVLIVALACSHPDPNSRPTMSRAMEFLHGKTHLPVIPASKPTPNYGPPPPMNVQQILQD